MTNTQSTTTVGMPALGESVEEGTITRWLKDPGDRVQAEEPLLEVATDKVDTEIPSPVTGVLVDILAAEDDVVGVGAALAIIATGYAAGDVSDTDKGTTDTPANHPAVRPAAPPAETEVVSAAPPRTAPREASSVTEGVVEKLPRIRRTIAARMVESLQTSAQLTTVLEVDVTEIARLRRAHKDEFLTRSGVKLSFFPFFAKAAVAALSEHRVLNASVNPDVTEITYHGACHVGIAVDSDKGLMVPVIREAQDLSIEGLARAIADKADRVRTGTITPAELGGGTFTLTNTGSRGALFDTPIINQPQTGILGIGAVVERLIPSRRDDNLNIDVRSMAYLSISYDHRVVDGADAARFLTAVKHRLEGGFSADDLR
ncbi:2-oxo acid dehydrogenase subunit E2 [Gordonia polyisoprenivorans]|uniref:2-oxo acid dehydrogenase subunit E2 n=1 Tax=Gordonia polyisoprenivorans TaxID=84595 RepID=UPI001AD706EE|nr:2-oxo acid dehydrogenase subunit E2 [Gordonia polyisoprenivorans]QTI70694.1 2-oxo acid dehydrogenase subunit E2 [Gordonia polyisoprenivorans]